MRLLHTSDWHLGRAFHGESLLREQEQAIDRMVEIVPDQGVELVVIAGDLYDRAIPPADAVRLFDEALTRLRSCGAVVVAIAGNHDSATRVGINDRLLAHAGVTVRGDTSRITEPLTLSPTDGGPPVAVYPVPFLEPSVAGPILDRLEAAPELSEDQGPRSRGLSHHDVTAQATRLIRAHAAQHRNRTVVVAHTFLDGGTTSDSERELRVGPVGHVDVVGLDAFESFDYVALGHLHGSQGWDEGRVAYSGTPLPYSFSEEAHTKAVRIVDLAPDGSCSVEEIPLGVGRRLQTITGTLEDLLADPTLAEAEQARVRVQLTDDVLPMQAMARIQARFPHAVVLQHQPAARTSPIGGAARHAIADRVSPIELSSRFWLDQHGVDATDAQLAILAAGLEAATGQDAR